MINKVFHYFERIVVLALLALMGIIIVISTIELVTSTVKEIISHDRSDGYIFLDMQDMLELFSFILLIVIGLELFETIKYYLNKHHIQADFILLVALTAIARKVIVFDYKNADNMQLIGIATVVAALSAGYFLIKKGDKLARIKKSSIDKEDFTLD